MLSITKSHERGHVQHGWLDSHHSFSFGSYYNPKQMGFGPLRVINEDKVEPGQGFGTHGHENMEIVSYVLSGSLEHKDSMGNGSVLRRGQVQRMSAGTGVLHSEFNPSATETSHFLQIWLYPNQKNIEPSYEEAVFNAEDKQDKWCLIASETGEQGSVRIHQDARLYAGIFNGQQAPEYTLSDDRIAYIHVVKGCITINGQALLAGDALKLTTESLIQIQQANNAEVLLFDMTAH
ncbi:MAG: pirin family protein [Advenella sp.]|nr:pirin family protein [Advenella sp.]